MTGFYKYLDVLSQADLSVSWEVVYLFVALGVAGKVRAPDLDAGPRHQPELGPLARAEAQLQGVEQVEDREEARAWRRCRP